VPSTSAECRDAGSRDFAASAPALRADVPVVLACLDDARRGVGLDPAWRLSGDATADLACLARRLQGPTGKRAEQAAPVRLI